MDLPEEKNHLESGFNKRGRAKSAPSYIKSFVKTAIFFSFPGLLFGVRRPGSGARARAAFRRVGEWDFAMHVANERPQLEVQGAQPGGGMPRALAQNV